MATPTLNRILVPDVSYAQPVGWQKLFRSGIVRTSYGTTEDKMLKSHLSYEGNTTYGFYHAMYCTSINEAIKEANFCADLIEKYKRDYKFNQSLPVYADYEYFSDTYFSKIKGRSATNLERTNMIKAFCETLESKGHFAGVYLNPDYRDNKVNFDSLKQFTLWLAHWGKDSENPVHQYGVININGTEHDINYVDSSFILAVTNFYQRKG